MDIIESGVFMLDQTYRDQVQRALTKHYLDPISNQDDHHVKIFTNQVNDNALITYDPYNLDDQNDNDGKVLPIRRVMIRAIAKNGKWTKLVNQQFIHAEKDASGKIRLNLITRNDNAISDQGQKKLARDLKQNFKVDLDPKGALIVPIEKDLTTAFVQLIKAIQFLTADGHNYVIKVNPVTQAKQEFKTEQKIFKTADQQYQSAHSKK